MFVEFKSPLVKLDEAIKGNYEDYLHTIPRLFDWNALVVVSNGSDAQYAALGAAREHFYRCKRLNEGDAAPAASAALLPLLLHGMLDKARLQSPSAQVQAEVAAGKLGVFWHTQGSGKSYSMVFLSEKIRRKVSAAYTFVIVTDRTELDDQIAQTYARCGLANTATQQASSGADLRKKLKDASAGYVFTLIQKYNEHVRPDAPYNTRGDIIVISDEAHRSNYGQFALNMRTGLPGTKFLAFTGTPLMDGADEITRKIFGPYVSVYDFQHAVDDHATVPLTYENRGEQLGITDEALNERIAQQIEAERRKAATQGKPWDDEVEAAIYRKMHSDYPVLTASQRIEKIASDFVEHFFGRRHAVDGGASKAMLVCIDKITCVRMYELIAHKWQEKTAQLAAQLQAEEQRIGTHPAAEHLLRELRQDLQWMRQTECRVIVSHAQGDDAAFAQWTDFRGQPLSIAAHRQKMAAHNCEQDFKDPQHPFRIAIVCAMWLTGFDVKCLATLYLDKPMASHTLMQAIARVNRTGGGKKSGLIVDYNGMLGSLRRALATFATGGHDPQQADDAQRALRSAEEALAEYAQALDLAEQRLLELGFDLGTLLALTQEQATCTDTQPLAQAQRSVQLLNTAANALSAASAEQSRAFLATVREAEDRARALFPHPGLAEHAQRAAALRAIVHKFHTLRTAPDISAVLQSLQHTVDVAIQIQNPPSTTAENRTYDLSKMDFAKLRDEFAQTPHKNIVILNLQEKIEARIKAMLAENPTRQDLYKYYADIIKKYNEDKSEANIQKTIAELYELTQKINQEDVRYIQEELPSQQHLAVFDLIRQKNNLSPKERKQIKKIAVELFDHLQRSLLQMTDWREKATVHSQIKGEISKKILSALFMQAIEIEQIQVRGEAITDDIFHYLYNQNPFIATPPVQNTTQNLGAYWQ